MQNEILLGSHVSFGSPNYFVGSINEALNYGENTFMFYTGAPQNNIRTPLEKCKIDEGLELLKKHNINPNSLVVHAPYIINLGNSLNENIFKFSKEILQNEINRTSAFKVKNLVLHPGLHVKAGAIMGLNKIVEGLNDILNNDSSDVIICLETMAGKGTELGKTFEEIAFIINHVKNNNRLGVCLDTCHIFDAGYNLENIDQLLKDFDEIIGLSRLKVIHLNDSKNQNGSHKDRHANIGKGNIGVDNLLRFVYHPLLVNIPKILETPYIDGKPQYKEEIEFIKNNPINF